MSDQSISTRIESLVDEEHALRGREQRDSSDTEALDDDRARLREALPAVAPG